MKNEAVNGFYVYGETPRKEEEVLMTGNPKLDDFFSKFNGLVRNSAIFFTGTSGAGKTTMAVLLQGLLSGIKTAMYSREMWAGDVEQQCQNINVFHGNAYIADSDSCPHFDDFMKNLDILKPEVTIIDSIQVIAQEDYKDVPEADAIYEIIKRVRNWNKINGGVLFVIGHVTKDGVFRGDNTIKQMFDAHLEMIYTKKKNERVLQWGGKNRKGDANKMLYYDFSPKGIEFYTATEWSVLKQKTSFDDFIGKAVTDYLLTLKDKDGYASIASELKKLERQLNHSNMSQSEALSVLIREIGNKLESLK
jgi:DNA repair protein RadA/Sms